MTELSPKQMSRAAENTPNEDGPIPVQPTKLAEIQPLKPGEQILTLMLSLSEVGCIAASLQTCVHAGWIREASQLNVANSVLRKFHEAKLKLIEVESANSD